MATQSTMTGTHQNNGAPEPSGQQRKPVSVPDFLDAKRKNVRLSMLTAYDYTMARILDEAGVDGILVGDSLGMVVHGNDHSLGVTLDEMIYHTRLVSRGIKNSLLVADMPFMSYHISPRHALENAGRLVKEGGAHAIKLEGGVRVADTIAKIAAVDIPVMGHVGMTPQSLRRFGGFKVQRDEQAIIADAVATEKAGAFAIVVECVPAKLAEKITRAVKIPTIGIGAGVGCDGQILVTHDMLGMYGDLHPRFVKKYADVGEIMRRAVESYCNEVREESFPCAEHSFR